mgnify:CR=1 FL=1|tara:strand:- start:170 stop:886 length:717 start_codon:yes stop_codon:yes gene_type:complete
MISIDTLKQYVDYISNKEQSGNNYSPKQFNMLVSRSIDDIERWLIGLVSEYRPMQPLPSVAYDITQKVKDDLRFLKNTQVLSVDDSGFMTIPSDYVYLSSISYRRIENNAETGTPDVEPIAVEVMSDDNWTGRLNNAIKKPTHEFPVCNFYDKTKVLFSPQDLGSVTFTYLKKITTPVWGYTLDENDNPIFDPSSSVDIDLPEILLNDIARVIIGYMGINIREEQLIQYAELVKTKGI